MLKQILKVESNREIQKNIFEMKLTGKCNCIKAPGQFVNIKINGFYLRRPISICSYGKDYINIVFKVVGRGTEALSEIKPGELIDVLIPLGNGFDYSKSGSRPLLVGGGIGVPPLLGLTKALTDRGAVPQVVMGFNSGEEIILTEEFELLGISPVVTTMDGSIGLKGLVTDAMETLNYDYVFSCGPEPMLKAVYEKSPDGQFSFEARMACGFGACMGCTCETKYGYKRICKDGPVLFKEEIKW